MRQSNDLGGMGCLTSCSGLYADVVFKKLEAFEDQNKLDEISDQYFQYKTSFARNLKFDPSSANLSRYFAILEMLQILLSSAAIVKHRPLQVVHVFFASATYDEVPPSKRNDVLAFPFSRPDKSFCAASGGFETKL